MAHTCTYSPPVPGRRIVPTFPRQFELLILSPQVCKIQLANVCAPDRNSREAIALTHVSLSGEGSLRPWGRSSAPVDPQHL